MTIGIWHGEDFDIAEPLKTDICKMMDDETNELFAEELLRRYALWKATESTIDHDHASTLSTGICDTKGQKMSNKFIILDECDSRNQGKIKGHSIDQHEVYSCEDGLLRARCPFCTFKCVVRVGTK